MEIELQLYQRLHVSVDSIKRRIQNIFPMTYTTYILMPNNSDNIVAIIEKRMAHAKSNYM